MRLEREVRAGEREEGGGGGESYVNASNDHKLFINTCTAQLCLQEI